MFGMGWAEIAVIGVVGMLVFGPEKLPELARQAGSMVRTVRRMAEHARDDLGREIGHDLSDMNLRDLDPREIVRRNLLDEPSPRSEGRRRRDRPLNDRDRLLRPGERPPFDSEAT